MDHPVFKAILGSNIGEVYELLPSSDLELESLQEEHGHSLITYAVWADNQAAIELLLKRGLSLDRLDPEGRSAISLATPEMTEFLIKRGADVNLKDAAQDGTALMYAAADNDLDKIRVLLRNGANPNVQDQCGVTALMCAVESQQFQAVQILITCLSTKLDLTNKDGHTAFDMARAIELEFDDGDMVLSFLAAFAYRIRQILPLVQIMMCAVR